MNPYQQIHILDGFAIASQYRRMQTSSYNSHAIDALDLLRQAEGYKPRFACVPDESNISVPARKQFEGQLWIQPGSIIHSIACTSQQADGFRLQILDAATGERFFATPQRFDPLASDTFRNQRAILAQPRLVLEPGLFNVTVTNLSSSDNQIQVTIFYAIPPAAPLDAAGVQLAASLNQLRNAKNRGVFSGSGSSISSSATSVGGNSSSGIPAWQAMPAMGQPYREAGAITTPEPGNEAVIHSFSVPTGWDGCIRALSNQYNGPGFEQGSGDLVWRLRVNGSYIKGYDNITTSLGDSSAPYELQGAIRIFSGQLVEYVVAHDADSDLATTGTQIIVTAAGWFWPKE